jgi:hypothetical protein
VCLRVLAGSRRGRIERSHFTLLTWTTMWDDVCPRLLSCQPFHILVILRWFAMVCCVAVGVLVVASAVVCSYCCSIRFLDSWRRIGGDDGMVTMKKRQRRRWQHRGWGFDETWRWWWREVGGHLPDDVQSMNTPPTRVVCTESISFGNCSVLLCTDNNHYTALCWWFKWTQRRAFSETLCRRPSPVKDLERFACIIIIIMMVVALSGHCYGAQ